MIEDVSRWEIDETLNASGTREKFWLTKPETGEKYLFKLPKDGTGEIWAEKVASEVGKALKLEMMDVSLATFNGRSGLILKNFIEKGNEEFFDGGDLLKTIVEDFDPNELDFYNLDNVLSCLRPFSLEKEIVKVILFDALIANQDRHCENWGVIQREARIRFAPIFDNGASLGFNNTEERIRLMFKDKNMFEAFTNKGKSIIGVGEKKKPKINALLSEVFRNLPDEFQEEIGRIRNLQNNTIEHILEMIPEKIMAPIHKQWVLRLLIHRKNWLLNWYEGVMSNE